MEPQLMSSRRKIAVGAVGLVLTLGLSALADEIVLVPGSTVKNAPGGRVRGTIQSESLAEVVVRLGANTSNVPTDQIVSIRYDGQPATMALAETNESGGQLAKAAELYKKAAGEAEGKPLVVQAARFKQAEVTAELALADPSKTTDAIGLLEGFVKAYPNGRQVSGALDSLARLQLQKGDYSAVDRTIGSLAKLPGGADRGAVLRAKSFAKQGDHAKAIAELDGLIKAAPEGSVRLREAKLAKAESLAGLKKFGEAETDLRAVIKALPAEDVAAQSAAYNTLGDCLRAAGRPKDALLAYLHTDVLFAKDKEQHPRALAQIAQLWRELKRDDRADEVLHRLRQEYPQSPWAQARKTP
jgi:tetratricopeptide (TPR) repeat protein